MTTDLPTGPGIPQQVHDNMPTNADDTIMDDPVVTMDSDTALMGGQTVTQPAMRQTLEKIVPQGILKVRR